ncbi:MAG: sigma-70 family RNA polymerase sigma factor [Phycisphaerales bacterium]
MTDEQCLKAVIEENCCAAFAALVERYYRRVYAICLRRLRNAADAEDATQEVFRKLLERPESIHHDLGGWLCSCAVNTSVSMIRCNSARRRREEQAAAEDTGVPQMFDAVERSEIVSCLLNELDAQQRELLIRHVVEGVSQSSLARELGVTQQAVALRMTTIRRRLRAWLTQRRLGLAGPVWLLAGWWTDTRAAVLRVLGLTGTTTGGGAITGASAGKSVVATAVTVGLISLLPGDDPGAFSHRSGQTRGDIRIADVSSTLQGSPDTLHADAGTTSAGIVPGRYENNNSSGRRALTDLIALDPGFATQTYVVADPLQYAPVDFGDGAIEQVNISTAEPVRCFPVLGHTRSIHAAI